MHGLLVSAASTYGFTGGHYWHVMLSDIREALSEHGIGTDFTAQSVREPYIDAISALWNDPTRHPDFVMTMNIVENFELLVNKNSTRVAELFMARPVTLLLDHPIHLAEQIADFEKRSKNYALRSGLPLPPIWGIMDPFHAKVLNDLGIGDDRLFLFGQAGPRMTAPPEPVADRDIDILFCGSLTTPPDSEAFCNTIHPDAEIREFVRRALDESLNNRDPYISLRQDWLKSGRRLDILATARFAKAVDTQARAVRRNRQLGLCAQKGLHICGQTDEQSIFRFPQAKFHGPLEFTDVVQLMKRAKIMVNDTINLDASLLMRAYYAMSQGCIVATESNAFVRENFEDGRNMIVLGESEADRERLRELLASPNQLHDLSLAAHAAQQADHCWGNRIPSLTQALKP